MRIQDIVTGDTETSHDAMLTDVVGEAKPQQKNTKHRLIRNTLRLLPFVCLVIAGLLAFGNGSISGAVCQLAVIGCIYHKFYIAFIRSLEIRKI